MDGEPYTTIQQLIRKAEADFQFRHAASLTLASRQQPQISEWLLSHARSSRADWRQYQQSLIDAQGSTFNLGVILTQVQERRKQRALAAKGDPTEPINRPSISEARPSARQHSTIIEHDSQRDAAFGEDA